MSHHVYYVMDQQDKLQPLAEMKVDKNNHLGSFKSKKKGDDEDTFRVGSKVTKAWKEKKPSGFNFKQLVGDEISKRPGGIFDQWYLPYRVKCYGAKVKNGNVKDNFVNSVGFFPMVNLVNFNGDHEIATLLIDNYCKWMEAQLLKGPLA